MKAPTVSSTRARVNTVYPPNKRALSYNAASSTTTARASNVSPKSMAAAGIAKRTIVARVPGVSSQPTAQRMASYDSAPAPLRRTTPPPAPSSRISLHAHQRALAAQRNAQRAHTRSSHLGSLDRGIRLLLEEEYREDVKAWMLEKEKTTMASASAMDQQPELQWHMRGHLLDFLLEIHLHFRLRPETLYLTLSILDRYVSRRIVYKKHYQLVGCVALWLAAKFEDAKERVPSVKDLRELCHGAYEEGAFVQMEGHVLGTVDWDLGHPTAESWLRILCTETHLPDLMSYGMFGGMGALVASGEHPFEETRVQHVARFLMEMTLYSREYLQFVPSVLALGALNLARYVCGKPRRPADESSAVLHMISLLDHTLAQNLDSVSQTLVKKYSYAHYSKASAVVVGHYLRGHRFPFNTTTSSAVESPESLATHTVSVDALRHAAVRPPVTPVRERMQVSWGSGRTDVEETPGLIRSDSSSSCIGMDVESDVETEEDGYSRRSFSEPREFEMEDDDDDDDEVEVDCSGVVCRDADDEDDVEDDDGAYSEDEILVAIPESSSQVSNASSMLTVPGSDESMPITPTTPMFQLDPFGSHALQQQQQQQPASNKENVVPNGGSVRPHQVAHPCHPNVASGVMVESGDDLSGHAAEYRRALLAIVP